MQRREMEKFHHTRSVNRIHDDFDCVSSHVCRQCVEETAAGTEDGILDILA